VTLIAIGLAVLLVAADFALFRLRRHRDERDHQAWREHEEAALELANGGLR